MIFLTGMFMTAIPWLIYFGMHGALGDLWTGYVYNNVFLYGNSTTISLIATVKSLIKNVLDAMLANWKFTFFMVVGAIWFLVSGRNHVLEKVNLMVLIGFTVLGVCWGVVQWQPYYALVFSVFSVFGWIAVIVCTEKYGNVLSRFERFLPCTALLIAMVLSVLTGNYTDQIGKEKNTLVQYQFAEYIEETEDATILNYGFQDSGFYTVCGITPQFKYFTRVNMQLPEAYEQQRELILNGQVDYVITRGFELEGDELTHYDKIMEQEAEYEGICYQYVLYMKRS
jgi:hypothetical protein